MDRTLLFPVALTHKDFLKSLWQQDFSDLSSIIEKQPQGPEDGYVTIGFALQLKSQLWLESIDRTIVKKVQKGVKISVSGEKSPQITENDKNKSPPETTELKNKTIAEKMA